MPFYRIATEAVTVTLHVQPGASHNLAAGLHGEALKVRVTARAAEGKANQAVIRLLASELGVPPSAVSILAGASSRTKRIRIECPPEKAKEIAANLERLARS